MILNLPVNPVSFGQLGYNILREFYKRDMDVGLFPIGQYDFSPFNPDKPFIDWVNNSINRRFAFLGTKKPAFKLWHLNGSEGLLNGNQVLLTFHETDTLTGPEINISKLQKKVFLTNDYAVGNFKRHGIENVDFVPLGLDESILKYNFNRKIDYIHWVIVGKFERRKHTAEIINAWCRKYGNNLKHKLSVCVYNPFMNEQTNSAILQNAFAIDGQIKMPANVNILPRLPLNSQMAELYHSADIDLGGMSGGEGLNLPSLTMTALGKWSIVLNAHAHKTWANSENAILVPPVGKRPAADGVFFQSGDPETSFNQGNFFIYGEEDFVNAMEVAEKKAKIVNEAGKMLQNKFNYSNCVDKIIEVCR